MKFERRFVKTKGQPYEGINFVERTSALKNSDGSSASKSLKVSVPDFWSQVATDILAQKYLRRAGIPEIERESDCRQVFHRLAGCWTQWGKQFGYFDTEDDAAAFYDETCYMLARQMCAPNSPQWFNTGLYYAYGIKGKAQGHYYVDPETDKVSRSKSAYERPQPHACFIQSISDDLVNEGGIMDLWVREARLFKYGSGTGTNFSALRGEGEPLSGGGISSGLMSFLKIGDRAAGAIKSGGTTRRAAKMVCLDVDHPDIEKFVNWKVIEEQKVAALVAGSKALEANLNKILKACSGQGTGLSGDDQFDPKKNLLLRQAVIEAQKAHVPLNYIQRTIDLAKQGVKDMEIRTYDTDWNSEAYSSVSGQNSNNSVRLTNEFMEAAFADKPWKLVFRTTGEIAKEISASDLWNDISYAAWACADPGVQFDTTINEWHTCPKDGRINASNPCSEYMFLDDTACNLASLNLITFYSPSTGFRIDEFIHATRIWTVILDISVQMAQFPSKEIARRSWDYRTLGLGYANIGALLMQMGVPYGSPKALALTGAITSIMCAESYRTSGEMAAQLGAFPRFEANRDDMLRVIRNHRSAAHAVDQYEGLTIKPKHINHALLSKEFSEPAKTLWDRALDLGEKHGFRNAQVTVIAPTGTIGLLMDCDTTGIEPDFALVKFKKLAGGGYFKIINQSIPVALKNLGYTDRQIDDIVRYTVGAGTLQGSPFINQESLRAKGFTEELLNRLEGELPQSFDIKFAFNKWTLGEDFCVNVLGLSKEQLDRPDLNILEAIGFSREQINAANEYVCGTMTVEGAPHLSKDHLPVFDCANKCGTKGTRFISAIKHIDMMAAAQPFISGAISKTINLPYEASIDDVKSAYVTSWKSMLKANAIYRDGSKLSQPLNTSVSDWSGVFEADTPTNEKVNQIVTKVVTKYLTRKKSLPHRRRGYTQKVQIGGHKIYLRTGEYEDGSLGEIFLDINKEGTLLRSMMNCFAVSVSLGLQYGVPLEDYVNLFTFTRFEPNGLVVGHDNIKRSTSIIDFIFRDLAINYLGRYDLAHSMGEESKARPSEIDEDMDDEFEDDESTDSDQPGHYQGLSLSSVSIDSAGGVAVEAPQMLSMNGGRGKEEFSVRFAKAKMQGYEGDPCPDCGAMTLVRNGSCLKCDSCGSTTGCS
jgi:ribonucleoside-diphosphate reductase alpha chain